MAKKKIKLSTITKGKKLSFNPDYVYNVETKIQGRGKNAKRVQVKVPVPHRAVVLSVKGEYIEFEVNGEREGVKHYSRFLDVVNDAKKKP